MAHPLVEAAVEAIRNHLEGNEVLPDEWAEARPWGIFVSLHEAGTGDREGPLRGCIGSLNLRETSVAQEVGRVAVSAATTDPRFPPLRRDEVEDLDVAVYLLEEPEIVDEPADLDPEKYGVIVTGPGGRSGLLLPAIPGIDSPEQQLELATRKAGLSPGTKVTIERFTATILR